MILEEAYGQTSFKLNSYFLDLIQSNVEEFLEIKAQNQQYISFYTYVLDSMRRSDSLKMCLNQTGYFNQ